MKGHDGVSVVMKDFSYTVIQKKRSTCSLKKTSVELPLLKNINLCVTPGSLLCILGPSGSGKSTLLNCLAARVSLKPDKSRCEGEILFNGKKFGVGVAAFSNYVMQKDKLHEFLTVQETLTICAALKMKTATKAERAARIQQVILDLGLQACRHVHIGGPLKKGISGGEMKRVSIAIELLDDPDVLFLDEPTSGLDSALAHETLSLLLKVARETGRSVVCTVHQPRSQVFALFENVLVLSKGRVVFSGPASAVQSYFAALGYSCPPSFNPADYILDLISIKNHTLEDVIISPKSPFVEPSGDTNPPKTMGFSADTVARSSESHEGGGKRGANEKGNELENSEENEEGNELQNSKENERGNELQNGVLGNMDKNVGVLKKKETVIPPNRRRWNLTAEEIDALADNFKQSELLAQVEARIELVIKDPKNIESREKSLKDFHVSVRSWFKEFAWIYYRTTINSLRNPILCYAQYVVNILLGLVLGGIFWQLEDTNDTTEAVVRNISGLLFFLAVNFSFSAFDAILSFPQDRHQYNRECAARMYTSSSYYVGKTVAELPFQQTPALVQMVLLYWMAGLRSDPGAFFMFVFLASLAIFASVGVLYCIGALSPNDLVANLCAPVVLIVFMLLSGFYLSDSAIPPWISWAKYITPMRFVYKGLIVNQFPGSFRGSSRDEIFTFISFSNPQEIYVYILTIIGLGLAYRFVAFLCVSFFNRRLGME